MWAKEELSGYSSEYMLIPFSVYVHTYVDT